LKSKPDAAAGVIASAADVSLRAAASIAELLNAIWYETDDARPICRVPSVESAV
jgi:hypothetical protein